MQDRRLSPHYSFERPVQIRGPQGVQFQAQACDISVTGLGLLLSHEVVVALAQEGAILTTGDGFQLVLPGTLNHSEHGGLTLECRVRHVRRLSRKEYQVGVWFVDPTPGQKTGVSALVEEARPPRRV